jgi:hypothetical protein
VLEAELEDKQAKALEAQEQIQDEEEQPHASKKAGKAKRGTAKASHSSNAQKEASHHDSDDGEQYTLPGCSTISLVPRKRAFDEDSDDEMDDDLTPQGSATDVEQSVVEYSSSDDETSGSDSE